MGLEQRSLQGLKKRSTSPKGYGAGKTYPKQVTCHKYTNDKNCATKKVTKTKTITAKPHTVTVKVGSLSNTVTVAIAY